MYDFFWYSLLHQYTHALRNVNQLVLANDARDDDDHHHHQCHMMMVRIDTVKYESYVPNRQFDLDRVE